MTTRIPALLLFCILFACTSGKNDKDTVQGVMGSENGGDFRGNAMGDDVTKVLAREESNVVYNMPDEITCRIPLEMADSTFYEVNYSFDEGELNHIQLNLFPPDADGLERLKADFSKYYSNVYRSNDVGKQSWITRSSRGKEILIKMTNRSETLGKPCLTITFQEER